MNVKYFELRCIAYLKKDIDLKESFDVLSKYISFSMAQVEELKELHNQRGFKHYSFGNLYPPQKDKVYKKGNSYQFVLRSLNETLVGVLAKSLRTNVYNPHLIIVETQKKVVKQFFVSELYSVTPVIVTVDKGLYWSIDKDGDILKLQKQLHDNLEKKYQSFYGESIKGEQNFIQLLEIKNKYPQSIYITKDKKDVRLFGNKFRIVPNEDEVSQKLAFLSLACGLGEKSSFGGGFCVSKGLQ
jgi:CRISPR-associated endoribonuclease Cas6